MSSLPDDPCLVSSYGACNHLCSSPIYPLGYTPWDVQHSSHLSHIPCTFAPWLWTGHEMFNPPSISLSFTSKFSISRPWLHHPCCLIWGGAGLFGLKLVLECSPGGTLNYLLQLRPIQFLIYLMSDFHFQLPEPPAIPNNICPPCKVRTNRPEW